MNTKTKGTIRSLAVLSAIVLTVVTTVPAAEQGNAGFEKLKSLVGTWEAPGQSGTPVTVTYKLVSGGSALMEELSVADMVTMYYPDGDSVMLTHYCAGNNQPRMRAAGLAEGSKLNFKFVDVTNEKAAEHGIMKHLNVAFQDADHFTAEWINSKEGAESPMVMKFTRKK